MAESKPSAMQQIINTERCRLLDELIASWRDKGNSPGQCERRIQARLAVEAAWPAAARAMQEQQAGEPAGRPLRMLTEKEWLWLTDKLIVSRGACEEVQLKFCEVNGLTIGAAPIQQAAQPEAVPAWQPIFDACSANQERLAHEFCLEIAGHRGQHGSPPDPVRLLEMAQALYEAERADLAPSNPEAQQAAKPAAAPGFKLVPLEPTPEMVAAYLKANDDYWIRTDELPPKLSEWRTGKPSEATAEGYRAMLAASPTAPAPATMQPALIEEELADCGLLSELNGQQEEPGK